MSDSASTSFWGAGGSASSRSAASLFAAGAAAGALVVAATNFASRRAARAKGTRAGANDDDDDVVAAAAAGNNKNTSGVHRGGSAGSGRGGSGGFHHHHRSRGKSMDRSTSPVRGRRALTPRQAYLYDDDGDEDSIGEGGGGRGVAPSVDGGNGVGVSNGAVSFGDGHHLSSSLFPSYAGAQGPATPSDGVPTPSESWKHGVGGGVGGVPSPLPRRAGGGASAGRTASTPRRRSSLGASTATAAATEAPSHDSETGGAISSSAAREREALLPPPPRGGSPLGDPFVASAGEGGGGAASVSASDAGERVAGGVAARRRLSAASAASAAAAAAAARHGAAAGDAAPSPLAAAADGSVAGAGGSTTEYNLRMQQLQRARQLQQQLQQQQRQQHHPSPSPSPLPPSLATGAAAGVAPSRLVFAAPPPSAAAAASAAAAPNGIGIGIPQPPPSHSVTSADDMAKEGALIEAAVAGGGGAGGGGAAAVPTAAAASAPPSTSATAAADTNVHNASAATAAYCRVITPEPAPSEEAEDVCALLRECLELRAKWLFTPATPPHARPSGPEAAAPSEVAGRPPPFEWGPDEPGPAPYVAEMVGGVMHVYEIDDSSELGGDDDGGSSEATAAAEATPRRQERLPRKGRRAFAPPGDANTFFADLHRVLKIASLGPVKSFAHHRLVLLEQKFNLHVMLNADKEFLAQKSAPHRDFYNVRKVDTHVHHSACMHQKHLLRFMKSKLRKEPDEVVIFRDGKYLTLAEVFESLRLTAHELNVDALDMHADKGTFHRFDRFNLKYNPFGQARLREVFIKQDNLIRGRFLAELTKEVFVDLEASKYQHAEYRVSIYGRKRVEWDTLAAWVLNNGLYSDNVVWLIQVPRLYDVYKSQGIINNFEDLIDNVFGPLFEATLDPASHPQLHLFLRHVVGFDMVDDESKPERRPAKHMPTADQWDLKHNPAYAFYAYYVYANLFTLNKLREARGLAPFSFRPHAGEAGDADHLVAALLLCENVAHGIGLRKSLPLQYLFYLAQVGLCMSPLSNNSLFLDYHRNPFPSFFARGLSVSLSTDDPLQIHLTKEPLVEEYAVAAKVWKLSAADLCEIARNGVLHSGFPHEVKQHWVSPRYWLPGPEGNDIQKTNVPNLRTRFRWDCLSEERELVREGASAARRRKAAREARAAAAAAAAYR